MIISLSLHAIIEEGEGMVSSKVDRFATADMWPDLFQGQSSFSRLRRHWRRERVPIMEFAMGRSQKSSHESHDDVTRSAHARVFMCGFPTKRKWQRRGRDGRKEGRKEGGKLRL